ncbi:MAG TPA: hypothetical protein VFV07_13355 [Rhizomicrobium sp.]|nr:hypothetical protein [Rhizomicrobium sp.]
MRLFVVTAAALLACSVCARADGTAPAIAPPAALQPVAVHATAAAPATAVKLICKPMYHEGMLLKGNDCRTQKEWDILRRDEEREISDFQLQSYR